MARPLIRTWRGSLQLRVVAVTLVASTLMVGAFGLIAAKSISDGLVDQRVESSVDVLESGREQAVKELSALAGSQDTWLPRVATELVKTLASQPGSGNSPYEVLLVPGPTMVDLDAAYHDGFGHPAVATSMSVPDDLRALVSDGRAGKKFVETTIDDKPTRPYVVFGTPLRIANWGSFQLYYFFPLDDEAESSAIVGRTLFIGGTALVLLLAVLAALVTRLVVTPVRVAARTAQRLSAGLLHERMTVKGADDLARLAGSFNLMAENLQQQIVRLEEMSRLQRRFTSDVSHELRTPLTTVRMAADLLHFSREDFPPEAARSAELLQDELNRFEDLLGELLEISRFDAGFAQLDADAVDLNPIVRSVVASFDSLAERCAVEVRVKIPQAPTIAEVDGRRVQRVLRNLVGNAVEHAEGNPVDVELAASDTAVAVTVRDRGVGLKPGEEKLVFNRFWRADPSRARQTGGTGLGLSISVEDAKLHGGWLEAAGEPGAGSVFRLTLPMRSGDRLLSSPLALTVGGPGDDAGDNDEHEPQEAAGGVHSG
ncbi:MtrAB system histidine kinase MtrB [Phytomonospora sp. NPDC050363]|uniref:MtrAB system histidine kinase MtrB n=1 Tax=Phytomonospora sp. NPDC050363 TaxID=3155642 RepID=UPI0033DD3FA7